MGIDVVKLTAEGKEKLKEFVERLNIRGALIATAEGLEMVSYFKESEDADTIAADTATILMSIQSFLEEVGRGKIREIIINAEHGSVIIKDLGDGISLAVIAPENYTLGSLLVSLRKFVEELKGSN